MESNNPGNELQKINCTKLRECKRRLVLLFSRNQLSFQLFITTSAIPIRWRPEGMWKTNRAVATSYNTGKPVKVSAQTERVIYSGTSLQGTQPEWKLF